MFMALIKQKWSYMVGLPIISASLAAFWGYNYCILHLGLYYYIGCSLGTLFSPIYWCTSQCLVLQLSKRGTPILLVGSWVSNLCFWSIDWLIQCGNVRRFRLHLESGLLSPDQKENWITHKFYWDTVLIFWHKSICHQYLLLSSTCSYCCYS